MAKKKEIQSIHIEPAANGHMMTIRYKGDKKNAYPYDMGSNEEKRVHSDCCSAAEDVHDLLNAHEGGDEHDIAGYEGEANENMAKHGYEKKSINDPKTKHPGFKKVASNIEKKEHVSSKAAAAILAASSRNASKSAHKENPRLNRVKG